KIKVDDLKKRIQEAEDKGADPAQLRNLKSLVKRLTGEEEVVSQQSDELINFLDDVYSPTKITDVIEEGAEKTLGASDLNLLKQEGRKIKSRVYGAPSDAANTLADDINKLYKESIDSTEAD